MLYFHICHPFGDLQQCFEVDREDITVLILEMMKLRKNGLFFQLSEGIKFDAYKSLSFHS